MHEQGDGAYRHGHNRGKYAGSATGSGSAVKAWVRENTSDGLTDEVKEKLERIFNAETEGTAERPGMMGTGEPESRR